jgi:DNA repair protein RecO (recombination protein O)
MKDYITEAIVLKSRPHGETDKTLEIFTKDFGRLSLKVKGGRKILSKFSPHLEPLNLVNIRLVKKENHILADVITKKSFAARKFMPAVQAKALELVYLLSNELPLNLPELNLWFSLVRALDSGFFNPAHFLKILGLDPAQASCLICAHKPVSYYSLKNRAFLCRPDGRNLSSNELIYIE